MSKRLGGIIGCKKYKTVVTLGQQYNIGEKPTVILYTYINRHSGTPEKQPKEKKRKKTWYIAVMIYQVLLHHRL